MKMHLEFDSGEDFNHFVNTVIPAAPPARVETVYTGELADWVSKVRTSKIEAIKAIRAATGMGFKDSKDVVEFLNDRISHPFQYDTED